jgi:hypothetical protein
VTWGVEIRGPRLVLRALRASEIEEEWQAMVEADPMVIAELPDESRFRARPPRGLPAGRLGVRRAGDRSGPRMGAIPDHPGRLAGTTTPGRRPITPARTPAGGAGGWRVMVFVAESFVLPGQSLHQHFLDTVEPPAVTG